MSRRSVLFVLPAVIAAGAFVVAEHVNERLFWNGSASAPIGFYRPLGRPWRRGDLVVFRPPLPLARAIVQRNLLPPGVPLIKHVAALSGDVVCRLGVEVRVNGTLVARALERDRAGRFLPRWAGCRVLGPRDVLLLQPHPRSFDGRYFGVQDARRVGPALCFAGRSPGMLLQLVGGTAGEAGGHVGRGEGGSMGKIKESCSGFSGIGGFQPVFDVPLCRDGNR